MPEPQGLTWLPIVFAAVAAGIVLVVARVVQDRRLRGLAPSFEAGTFAVTGFLTRWATGRVEGFECRYRVVDRNRNDPGGARLGVAARVPFHWQATRSSAASRAMVRIGVLHDVEIGEPQLDEALRFTAPDGVALKAALADLAAREALARLAATANFMAVSCDARGAVVRWRPRARGVDERPEVVAERIAAGLGLARALGWSPTFG